jgi:transketolase
MRAWLVTGPLGRGLAFAIDFAAALRKGLLRRDSSRVEI